MLFAAAIAAETNMTQPFLVSNVLQQAASDQLYETAALLEMKRPHIWKYGLRTPGKDETTGLRSIGNQYRPGLNVWGKYE